MLQKRNKHLNETGFASVVIALLMIIILSLLTVAFAQLARREQQNALDKQLATQAYNAAESGINDANQAIQNHTITSTDPTNCLGAGDPTSPWINHTIGVATHGISYTCLIVNLTPNDLVKDPVSPGSSWTTSFSTTGGGALDSFVVNWNSKARNAPQSGLNGFSPSIGAGAWTAPAVLQVSITPLAVPGRDAFIGNTYTVFLYPSSMSGSATYASTASNPAAQGAIVSGNCNGSGSCHVTIGGLSASPGGNAAGITYLLHIVNYYDTSAIDIGDALDTASNPLKFTNSQATIDATGKAKNVLKRILVHAPINPEPRLPSYGLEGQDICKRFTTDPIGGTQKSQPSYYTGTACDLN